jgi:hypothetical protein
MSKIQKMALRKTACIQTQESKATKQMAAILVYLRKRSNQNSFETQNKAVMSHANAPYIVQGTCSPSLPSPQPNILKPIYTVFIHAMFSNFIPTYFEFLISY